jgi:hypothetical protein
VGTVAFEGTEGDERLRRRGALLYEDDFSVLATLPVTARATFQRHIPRRYIWAFESKGI